jgi:hypothetical protein
MFQPMADVLKLIWWAIIGMFRSRASLEVEIMLRQQLNVPCGKARPRLAFGG